MGKFAKAYHPPEGSHLVPHGTYPSSVSAGEANNFPARSEGSICDLAALHLRVTESGLLPYLVG